MFIFNDFLGSFRSGDILGGLCEAPPGADAGKVSDVQCGELAAELGVSSRVSRIFMLPRVSDE
jgi:hypothetical protein